MISLGKYFSNHMPQLPTPNVLNVARAAYEGYHQNDKDAPIWDVLPEHIKILWVKAAGAAIEEILNISTIVLNKPL